MCISKSSRGFTAASLFLMSSEPTTLRHDSIRVLRSSLVSDAFSLIRRCCSVIGAMNAIKTAAPRWPLTQNRKAGGILPAVEDCRHGHCQVLYALRAFCYKVDGGFELAQIPRTQGRDALTCRFPPLAFGTRRSCQQPEDCAVPYSCRCSLFARIPPFSSTWMHDEAGGSRETKHLTCWSAVCSFVISLSVSACALLFASILSLASLTFCIG